MDSLEERVLALESKFSDVDSRLSLVEKRVDTLDSKMDTLLDSTSQIKAILSDNTKVTQSARRNTRGWGFFSLIFSVLAKIAEILVIRR